MAEANPLVEKIGENLLQCAICCEQFQDPVALPCQHGFCRECLEGWANKSAVNGKLMCPTCRKELSLPVEGVKGLPVHFLVSSLKDICEEEEKQVTCGNCNKPERKAKFHCFDCKEYLCEECHTFHKSLKLTKNHKVVTVDDFQSGKVTDEGRYCKVHGNVIVEFYCETEQKQVCSHCISLKTCPIGHERISLKDAATKQVAGIEMLIKKCVNNKRELQDVLQKTEQVQKKLENSRQLTKSTFAKVREEYIDQLDYSLKKDEDNYKKEDHERMKKIISTKQQLAESLAKIDHVCQQGSKVIQSESGYEITSAYASLTENLQNLSQSKAIAVDTIECLGYLKYVPIAPTNPILGTLSIGKNWKLIGQFSTAPGLTQPLGVALNQDGDVAVTRDGNGVKVFTRTGQVKCTFKSSPDCAYDIAVTPDNRYIIDGGNEFLGYDSQGNQLSKTPTYDMDDEPSTRNLGISVDTKGRIIAAILCKTISIHHADGTLINKFATEAVPCSLSITSKEELAVCMGTNTLKLMDYTGGNVRDIQPPPPVRKWKPYYVCCNINYGEIFVCNYGDPKGVYRYSSDGKYLGLVTAELTNPMGLAVSQDGQELLVAEKSENVIKIFQRQ